MLIHKHTETTLAWIGLLIYHSIGLDYASWNTDNITYQPCLDNCWEQLLIQLNTIYSSSENWQMLICLHGTVKYKGYKITQGSFGFEAIFHWCQKWVDIYIQLIFLNNWNNLFEHKICLCPFHKSCMCHGHWSRIYVHYTFVRVSFSFAPFMLTSCSPSCGTCLWIYLYTKYH